MSRRSSANRTKPRSLWNSDTMWADQRWTASKFDYRPTNLQPIPAEKVRVRRDTSHRFDRVAHEFMNVSEVNDHKLENGALPVAKFLRRLSGQFVIPAALLPD